MRRGGIDTPAPRTGKLGRDEPKVTKTPPLTPVSRRFGFSGRMRRQEQQAVVLGTGREPIERRVR